MKKTNRSQVRLSGKRVQVLKSEANLGFARLRAIPFALAIAFGSASSFADPAGAVVAAGQAAISSANGITTIQQMSDRAVVNWQSFNVNAGEAVKFVQPSSTAAILNRVTGGSVSNINGLVEGNGRVYLINPNGIVVGANGVVNVNGGFVASTKSLADNAFMSGGALVFTGESTGSIQILGKVQSAQGDVILIAPKIAIEKTGSLIAGQTIKLVAANEVELSNGKFTVKPKAGDAGQLTVEGALEAAKVQLAANNNNLGALAINTTGTIRATGTQTNPDGSVSIIATGEGGNINISGNIRSEKGDGSGGAVTVLADNNIRVSGTINANSTDAAKKGGDIIIGRDTITGKLAKATDVSGASLESKKGFVETSGDYLKTTAVKVKASQWLLDPTNINIVGTNTVTPDLAAVGGVYQPGASAPTSEILAGDIGTALSNGTNVTITTTNSGATGTDKGNITVSSDITAANSSGTDSTLTLNADNGIKVNANITATGSNKVNVAMTALGAAGDADSGIKITKDIKVSGSIMLDGTSTGRTGIDGSLLANFGKGSVGLWIYGGNNGVQHIIAGDDITLKGTNTFVTPAPAGGVTLFDYGLCISSCVSPLNAGTTNISSSNGAVTMTGSTQTSRGVSFGNGSGTNTYSITANKDITIQGVTQGKQAAAAYGVFNHSSSQLNLTSTTGKISINGDASAGSAGTLSTAGTAVEIRGGIDFNAAKGSEIVGKARPAAGHGGVWILSNTASTNQLINVSAGDLAITGTATGAAYGMQVGVSATDTRSTTIKNTNGKISLTGTADSSSGIVFNGKSEVDAKDYRFEGTSVSSSGIQFAGTSTTLKGSNSINVIGKSSSGLGIGFSGTTTVDAKDYVLEGTSTSSTGIQFTGTSTTLKASNSSNVIGKSTSAGAGAGILFSNTTVNINAPDTIINNFEGTSASRSGIQIGTSGTTTNINASSTKLKLVGTSTASNGGGISYFGTSTISSKTLDAVGKNLNYVGIFFQGNANATIKTSAANSVMAGSGSAGGLGVWADTGTVVTLDSGANSTSNITLKTGTDSLSGIRIGWAGNSTFYTKGDVTIGSNDSSYTNNASVMMQGTINATGKFTMKGRSAGDGIFFQDGAGFGAQIIGSPDAIITLDGTSTGGGSGINLSLNSNGWKRAHLISTTGVSGQINLKGVSASGTGVFTGQAQIIGNNGSNVFIHGQGSRGVYIGATNSYLAGLAEANIPSINARSVKVLGTATNTGVQIDGTVNTSAAVSLTGDAINISGTGGTGAGVILSGKVNNDSNGGATTIQSTNSNINFGSAAAAVTNASTAGTININAIGGANSTSAITSATGATITQKSNAGVTMTTDGLGNLTVAKIINNGSGDVILAAGKQLAAGNGAGGQIKTVTGNNVGGSGAGKLYVYTGSAAGTGLLETLTGGSNTGFSTLSLSDYTDGSSTIKQNAAANVAYTTGSSRSVISPNTSSAQVMFREKVAIDSSSLNGASLGLTYGDADTNVSHTAALFSKMQAALRQNNLGTTVTTTTLTNPSTSGLNTFRISKAAVINDMTGSLTSPSYSTSQHLTATTHNYGALNGTNYTTSLAANKAQVVVRKLPIQVFAQYTSLNYTGALLTQNQPSRPFISGDNVVVSGLATGTAVGSYLSALRANGDDVGNYDIQFVNDNLVIAYSGTNKAPTPPETYTRIAGDVVNLAPLSFAVGVAAATAAGDEADPNICYAWGQRNGGSVTVHTVLKPAYLGLRHAKTDTQEAMSNSGGSSSHSASPCGHDVATNVAEARSI